MSSSRKFGQAIDPEVLEGLRSLQSEDDPHFLKNYLNLFLAPIPGRLDAIDRALQTGDMQLLQMEAHALKSSSANTGAVEMSSLCSQLEQIAKGIALGADAGELLTRLKTEYAQVKEQIHRLPEF